MIYVLRVFYVTMRNIIMVYEFIMKKGVLFACISVLLIILLGTSCKKKDEHEYKDVYGDIIFTDSFSPMEWENPGIRRKVEAVDKDIGQFIKQDIMDPKLRKIMKLMEKFISYIHEKNVTGIQNILTPSAFNSYTLRAPEVTFIDEYEVRVAYPDSFLADDPNKPQSIDAMGSNFWIKFKVLSANKSLYSTVELQQENDEFKISDFENKFFSDILRLVELNKGPADLSSDDSETKKTIVRQTPEPEEADEPSSIFDSGPDDPDDDGNSASESDEVIFPDFGNNEAGGDDDDDDESNPFGNSSNSDFFRLQEE